MSYNPPLLGAIRREENVSKTDTMSTFVDDELVEKGKQDIADHLERAVREKAEENMALFQELMRKQDLLEKAELLAAELEDIREQDTIESRDTKVNSKIEVNLVGEHEITDPTGSVVVPLEGDAKVGEKLAPYNPTNIDACHMALKMMNLCDDDVLYDLGCGDGRMLIEAWKEGRDEISFRAVGVEYDGALCNRARENVESSGFSEAQISIVHDNVLNVDFTEATVLFIYLVPAGMAAIRDCIIRAMRERNVRVITYVFSLSGLEPVDVQVYKQSTKIYSYDRSSLSSLLLPGEEEEDRGASDIDVYLSK